MSPSDEIFSFRRRQRSIEKAVSVAGIGLFTGTKGRVTFEPAPEGTGILFRRIDLPGEPAVTASVDHVLDTPRCTVLGDNTFRISTVEHILSALKAYEIDDVVVAVEGEEVPVCDGSGMAFVDMIREAGIVSRPGMCEIRRLHAPFFRSEGDVHLIALPSEEFRVSYTLNYPDNAFLRAQFFTIRVDAESYTEEIAPARTFALHDEVVPLVERGYLAGGNLKNALVVKGDGVLNPEDMRYPDEPVRHKILDLIGDLSLVGKPFHAHVIAIRSGHRSNILFARDLINHLKSESTL